MRITTAFAPAMDPALAAEPGSWWTPLLRGLAAICFGMLAIVWPAPTLLTLVMFFGAFALIDGLLAVFGGLFGKSKAADNWLSVAMGFLGIAAGLISLSWPRFVVVGLVVYAGVWAVFRGGADIVSALRWRGMVSNTWSLLLSGVLTIALGILILIAPRLGLVVVVWAAATCAIALGTLLVAFALHVRARDAAQSKARANRGATQGG